MRLNPERPNKEAVGELAAEHLGPILYALETCALVMEDEGREDDARYYRSLASRLADAGASPNQG
jgi:hypothetical protein